MSETQHPMEPPPDAPAPEIEEPLPEQTPGNENDQDEPSERDWRWDDRPSAVRQPKGARGAVAVVNLRTPLGSVSAAP